MARKPELNRVREFLCSVLELRGTGWTVFESGVETHIHLNIKGR
jgi:hypothetical protein